jgi:hypothetical protein
MCWYYRFCGAISSDFSGVPLCFLSKKTVPQSSGGRGVSDGLEALELLEILPDLLPHLGLVQLLGAAGLLDLDGEVVHGPGHHLLPHLHQPLELQHRVLRSHGTGTSTEHQ